MYGEKPTDISETPLTPDRILLRPSAGTTAWSRGIAPPDHDHAVPHRAEIYAEHRAGERRAQTQKELEGGAEAHEGHAHAAHGRVNYGDVPWPVC